MCVREVDEEHIEQYVPAETAQTEWRAGENPSKTKCAVTSECENIQVRKRTQLARHDAPISASPKSVNRTTLSAHSSVLQSTKRRIKGYIGPFLESSLALAWATVHECDYINRIQFHARNTNLFSW